MVTHLANHRQNHQSYHRQNQHQNHHPQNHDFDDDFLEDDFDDDFLDNEIEELSSFALRIPKILQNPHYSTGRVWKTRSPSSRGVRRSAWASIRVRGELSGDSTKKSDLGIWRWLQLGKNNPESKINPKNARAKIIDFLENT